MRSWPNLFQTSESVSSQFVCLLVWICATAASFHFASNKAGTDSVLFLLGRVIGGNMHPCQAGVHSPHVQDLLLPLFLAGLSRDECTIVHVQARARTHKITHINLSSFSRGLRVPRLNSASCSAAPRCGS